MALAKYVKIGGVWKLATGDMVIYVNGREAAKRRVGKVVQDPAQVGEWLSLGPGEIDGTFDELYVARRFAPALIAREMASGR